MAIGSINSAYTPGSFFKRFGGVTSTTGSQFSRFNGTESSRSNKRILAAYTSAFSSAGAAAFKNSTAVTEGRSVLVLQQVETRLKAELAEKQAAYPSTQSLFNFTV